MSLPSTIEYSGLILGSLFDLPNRLKYCRYYIWVLLGSLMALPRTLEYSGVQFGN